MLATSTASLARSSRALHTQTGVCAYTGAKYNKDTNMTMGDVTTCERFKDLPGVFPAQEDVTMSYTKCATSGQVVLPFGAAEYVGLGFCVFLFLIITEIFGSPFIRNCQVAIALIIGFIIAAASSYTPPDAPDGAPALKYVTSAKIDNGACAQPFACLQPPGGR